MRVTDMRTGDTETRISASVLRILIPLMIPAPQTRVTDLRTGTPTRPMAVEPSGRVPIRNMRTGRVAYYMRGRAV